MKYAEAREQIKSGDLLFWTHRRLQSWYDFKVMCVRVGTMSKYCHVGTAWVFGGRVFVIEAVTPHPRIVPLSNFLPCDWSPQNAPWKPETEEFALSVIGKEDQVYSQLDAIKAALGQIDPAAMNGRWICSKLAWVLQHMDGLDAGGLVTPSAMADHVMTETFMKTIEA